MLERKSGTIINVASTAGLVPGSAGHTLYAVAGLVGSYLGIYFYLRVIQYAFMSGDAVAQPANQRALALSASVLCLVPAVLLLLSLPFLRRYELDAVGPTDRAQDKGERV